MVFYTGSMCYTQKCFVRKKIYINENKSLMQIVHLDNTTSYVVMNYNLSKMFSSDNKLSQIIARSDGLRTYFILLVRSFLSFKSRSYFNGRKKSLTYCNARWNTWKSDFPIFILQSAIYVLNFEPFFKL